MDTDKELVLELLQAIRALMEAYAPGAEQTARSCGAGALHPAVRTARAILQRFPQGKRPAAIKRPAMQHRQTVCRHCGQDIEAFAPYRIGSWRDRGGNAQCPYPAAGKIHAPVRQR
jgi:hypothetical protein